ncbi:MAG TPA: transglutaminase family protein [Pirellulales bacterium]|nr:transglutaminase family protein [Pirellulales bacterium]
MKYNVIHITRYMYTDTATLCHNQAHLTPRESARQKCTSCKLDIHPGPAMVRAWADAFGNTATYFSIEQAHRELSVVAKSQVEVLGSPNPPDPQLLSWEDAVERLESPELRAQHDPGVFLCRFNSASNGDEVRKYGAQSFARQRSLFDAVLELTMRIYADFRYDPAATSISTPPAEILQRRRGVCQDFAHLQIACLRSLGLSARYVSGYLVTKPPPGKPKLVGADATHAWVSVYFPDWGWVDFDPTNRQLADADYITLAWGRDYADVSPIRGVFLGGGAHYMTVSVDVTPGAN